MHGRVETIVFAFMVFVLFSACAGSEPADVRVEESREYEVGGKVIRLEAAMDDLVAPEAVVERVATGFRFH